MRQTNNVFVDDVGSFGVNGIGLCWDLCVPVVQCDGGHLSL